MRLVNAIIIFFCLCHNAFLKVRSSNLVIVLSVDKQLRLGKDGMVDSIIDFKASQQQVNVDYEILDNDDESNDEKVCRMVESDPFIIIVEASESLKPPHNSLKLLARNVGIPIISESVEKSLPIKKANEEWINLSEKEKNFLISYELPSKSITRSIISLAEHFHITNGVIFSDSDMDQHFSCLLAQSKPLNFSIELLKSPMIEAMSDQIKLKKKSNFRNYFVVANSKVINLFLESFRRNDMFQQPFTLTAVCKDLGKVKCTLCKHGQLTIVKPTTSIYEYETGNFTKSKLLGKDQVDYFFYYDLTRWLLETSRGMIVQNKWKSEKEVKSCQSRRQNTSLVEVPLATNLLKQKEKYGRFGRLQISSELEPHLEPAFIFQEISAQIIRHDYRADRYLENTLGVWDYSPPTGSVLSTAKLEEDEEDDEKDDGQLKVLLFFSPPFVTKRVVNNSVIYEGFLIDLFNEIRRLAGPQFPPWKFRESSSITMGVLEQFEEDAQSDNVNPNGLLKELQDCTGDCLALAAMGITESRELIIDFTEPIFDLIGIAVLMKKPPRRSHAWMFLSVLETDVWTSVTAAYFFTSILLAIFDRFSPYSYRNKPEKYVHDEDKRLFTLKETLWFCFISLTPQGGGDAPKCVSGRLVAAIWWLLGFIFIASYTANLAAFLTVSRLSTPVDSMATLTKQYKVRYAPVENSETDAFFLQMAYTEDKYYEIWKNLSLDDDLTDEERANLAVWEYPISDTYTKIKAQIVEAKRPSSLEEGVRRVRASNTSENSFALLSSSLDVEYFAYLYCDMFKAGDDFGHHPIALPITKTSRNLKRLIDPAIKQLKDSDFVEQLRIRYWYSRRRRELCSEYRVLSNGLNLFNTYGMFAIFPIGLIAGLVLVSVENWLITLWEKRASKKKRVLAVTASEQS